MSSIVVSKKEASAYATIISTVYKNDVLYGFNIVIGTGSVMVIPLDNVPNLVQQMLEKKIFLTNATYDSSYKTFVGIGHNLTDYPRIDLNGNLISKNGITLVSKIRDADSGEPIGVVVYNGLGERFNVSFNTLARVLGRANTTNFKLDIVDGNYVVEEIEGCLVYDITLIPRVKKQSYNSYKGDDVPELNPEKAATSPTIGAYSLEDLKGSEIGLNTQQKMMLATHNLMDLAPYYSCLFEALDRRVAPGLDTMAVTEGTLYYSSEFPAQLSVGELTFVLLHEVLHLAMQHSVRKGGRHHFVWNIATDMYINSLLCADFDLEFGVEKVFDNNSVLKTFDNGIFPETAGVVIDLSKDTPESIYEILIKENPDLLNQGQGQSSMDGSPSQGNGDSDDGQDGSSSNSSSSSSENGEQGNSSNSTESDNGNSSNSDSNNGSSNEGGSWASGADSSSDGDGQDKKDSNESGNSDDSQQDGENGESKENKGAGSDGAGKMREVTFTYQGKKITGKVMVDVCTNDKSDKDESISKNIEDSKNALQKMKTKVQIKEQELGQELDKSYGIGGAGLVARHIEFGLTEGIDWRVLMKNISVDKPKKIFTMAMPNVDYMNMGITLATQQRIGKPTRAAKFVVAIDVSGSVSKADLDYWLSEVNTLTRTLDVEAELVFWSDDVGDSGMFSDMRSLLKVEPLSSGGTDVSHLFKYLMGEEKTQTGKIEPLRVRDIRGVFIITDGCFAKNYDFATEYFASKTVWLIDGNPVLFDPCFGRVLQLEKKM